MKVYTIKFVTSKSNSVYQNFCISYMQHLGKVFSTHAAAQKAVEKIHKIPEFEIVPITLEGTDLSDGGIFFEEGES